MFIHGSGTFFIAVTVLHLNIIITTSITSTFLLHLKKNTSNYRR